MNPLPKSLIIFDWILVIYTLVSILLLLLKKKSDYKFLHFTRLIFSDTYIKTYKSDSLFKGFHIVLNIIAVLLFPLLLLLVVTKLFSFDEILFSSYMKYLFFFSSFYFTKLALQLFFAKLFNCKKLIYAYVFQKQTYFTYLCFLSLLPALLLIFTPFSNNISLYVFTILWIVLFSLSLILTFFRFKEVLLSQLLYFILYICTFEISPIIGVIYFTRL